MKKQLKITSYVSIILGCILVIAGIWSLSFTYNSVKQENIITPEDASIPNQKVVGPLTLKSQSDIIRFHTLNTTGGKTYAEMPRQIPKLDENGKEVLDSEGKVVMVDNGARNIWITATSLMTALHLAIMAYGLFILVIIFGLSSIWNGYVFCLLAKKEN